MPLDTSQSLALCLHNAHGLSLSRNRLQALQRAGGTWGPQLGGDPVSAGLLGAGLLLCMERGQVNRQGTAGGDHGAGRALPGRGVHLLGITGAMGGDCIRGCTSVWPLITTPWLESPLSPPNPRPAAFAHPPSGGEAPVMADPSLWVGHPCPTFSPT